MPDERPVLPFLALPPAPSGPWRRPVRALPPGTFVAASLGDWLDIAARAGVPVVPATQVARLPLDALLQMEDPACEPAQAAARTLAALARSLPAGHMLRWDCCAGFDLKMAASDGQAGPAQAAALDPIEPRTLDLLFDFPDPDIRVWSRPWVDAAGIDGYPVEFRAFIAKGEVVGLANYYLQRPLAPDDRLQAAATQALGWARCIAAQLRREPAQPAMPGMTARNLERAGVHATLDFLLDPNDRVWLLEAGPGFGFGAHPCAFLNDDGTVDPLDGIKWAAGQPAQPLPPAPASPPPTGSRPGPG